MQQLPKNTLLQGGKYKVEKVIAQGGFGITYLAIQELLDRQVCIKEFFFKEYCERNNDTSQVTLGTQSNHEIVERFMTKFLKEARTISQLDHPNIIHILDIFKENNTVYYVMEYIEGESLNDMVCRDGALSESKAVDYIKQVAYALDFIHQRGINHLDVKPANIMIRKRDNLAILIDFGLSKQYDVQGEQTSTTPIGISYGYAPIEQYNSGGVSTFSAQTDVYSLGATLYKLVTGNTPPQATDIFNEGMIELPPSLSSYIVEGIKKAMQPRKADRCQNVAEFMNILNNVSSFQKTNPTQDSNFSDEETKILKKNETLAPINKSIKIDSTATFLDNTKAKKQHSYSVVKGLLLLFLIIPLFLFIYECEPTLVDKARKGDVQAQFQLGINYYNGNGEYALNKEEAVKWYCMAAEQGLADAQLRLGLCYVTGDGVTQNYGEAIKWFRKAAEQGLAEAQFHLGQLYYYGDGVPKNLNIAKQWLEKAAAQGHKEASTELEQLIEEEKKNENKQIIENNERENCNEDYGIHSQKNNLEFKCVVDSFVSYKQEHKTKSIARWDLFRNFKNCKPISTFDFETEYLPFGIKYEGVLLFNNKFVTKNYYGEPINWDLILEGARVGADLLILKSAEPYIIYEYFQNEMQANLMSKEKLEFAWLYLYSYSDIYILIHSWGGGSAGNEIEIYLHEDLETIKFIAEDIGDKYRSF